MAVVNTSSRIVELDDNNFAQEVLACSKTVMVVFQTDGMADADIMAPIIEDVAAAYEESLKIGRLNSEKFTRFPKKYGILGMLTFLFFKKGRVVGMHVGALSRESLMAHIDRILEWNG